MEYLNHILIEYTSNITLNTIRTYFVNEALQNMYFTYILTYTIRIYNIYIYIYIYLLYKYRYRFRYR